MSSSEGNEDLLEDVFEYLTEKKYRDGLNQNQKRVVRRKAGNFHLDDGQMIFKRKQRGRPVV